MMTRAQLASYLDAALLKPDVRPADVAALCKDARKYRFAAADVNPCYLVMAVNLLKGSGVRPITVVGYPLGATTVQTKVAEATEAIRNGAVELDMVMAIGRLKAGDFNYVKREIGAVVGAAGIYPVKVIIETGYLTNAEIAKASKLVKAAGAAFVKTGTGWGPRDATVKDVQIMRRAVGPSFGIKAAGGIRTAAQATRFIAAGATRIGTSAAVAMMQELRK